MLLTSSQFCQGTHLHQTGVTRLMLSYFRNYEHLDLLMSPLPTILTGPNGAGKTNLLEALSLLSPGRGLHRSKLSTITNALASTPSSRPYHWTVAVDVILENGESLRIGTGLEFSQIGTERRHIKINGALQKKQSALSELLNVVWVTPQMGTLFIESGQNRRKFIDQLSFSLDPLHGDRLQHYDYYLRQRSQLLKSGGADPTWLNTLEQKCAQDAVAITSTRLQTIHLLNTKQSTYEENAFPRFTATLKGDVESLLKTHSALQTEEVMVQRYREARSADSIAGGSQVGPHRSDFSVINLAKNLLAEVCSTGEQKMILLALILAFAKVQLENNHRLTLLLLDDVIAHLDETHRALLCQELCAPELSHMSLQTWMTGTDPHEFNDLRPYAQFFSVYNAQISNG